MASVGTTKFYNKDKGFGFIKPDSGDKDLFVHATALKKGGLELLEEGDRVQFEVEDNPNGRGPRAINVSMAN